MSAKYEYAVHRKGDRLADLHRGPMTERQARAWVREAIKDGFPEDYFTVIRREVRPWERES